MPPGRRRQRKRGKKTSGTISTKGRGHARKTPRGRTSRDQYQRYALSLYITGATEHSLAAVANVRRLCEELLPDRYDLEIVDLYREPQAAVREDIIAAPTLVKRYPPPLRRFVGDLSNREKVVLGLDLWPKDLPAFPTTPRRLR